LAVVLGLASNIAGYINTTTFQIVPATSQGALCQTAREPYSPATKIVEAGTPLKSTIHQNISLASCDDTFLTAYSNPQGNTKEETPLFMNTWQFYVDWSLWSLPWLGMAYLINKRHAHTRH